MGSKGLIRTKCCQQCGSLQIEPIENSEKYFCNECAFVGLLKIEYASRLPLDERMKQIKIILRREYICTTERLCRLLGLKSRRLSQILKQMPGVRRMSARRGRNAEWAIIYGESQRARQNQILLKITARTRMVSDRERKVDRERKNIFADN